MQLQEEVLLQMNEHALSAGLLGHATQQASLAMLAEQGDSPQLCALDMCKHGMSDGLPGWRAPQQHYRGESC